MTDTPTDPNTLHCQADQSKCRGKSYCYCDCWSCKQACELAIATYDERVRKIAIEACEKQNVKTKMDTLRLAVVDTAWNFIFTHSAPNISLGEAMAPSLDALINAVSEEIITAVTDNQNLHKVLEEPFRKVLTEMILEEREACAKIAESGRCSCHHAPCEHDETGKHIAHLIRAQRTP